MQFSEQYAPAISMEEMNNRKSLTVEGPKVRIVDLDTFLNRKNVDNGTFAKDNFTFVRVSCVGLIVHGNALEARIVLTGNDEQDRDTFLFQII